MCVPMKKHEAISLFRTVKELATALDITPQAIYQWPDELPQEQVDRVTGAAVRLGKFKSPNPLQRAVSAIRRVAS